VASVASAARRDVPDEEGRSARKHRLIMEAATAAFLRNGYLGTSVDEIAAAAGVSKPTVYKLFTDKERLFTEFALGTIDQVSEPFFAAIGTLEEGADPVGAPPGATAPAGAAAQPPRHQREDAHPATAGTRGRRHRAPRGAS
jgi:AcrR family transcriptional regulator